MSNTFKLKDKKTGKVIKYRLKEDTSEVDLGKISVSKNNKKDLPFLERTFGTVGDVEQREANVEQNIQDRGSHFGNIKRSFQKPGFINKGIGVLQALDTPLTLIESGGANTALELQRGNINPEALAKEAYKGFIGKQQGQYGDVGRIAGYPEWANVAMGVTLNMAPIKALHMINKSVGQISKWNDKRLLKGGKDLISATKKAEQIAGSKVDEAFKVVDDLAVDGEKFLDDIAKLPKGVIVKIEEAIGNIDDIAQNLTVKQIRAVKRIVGKYNPNKFGRGDRGLAENLDADTVNKVYSSLKKSISNTVTKAKGKKTADALMRAEKDFTRIIRANNTIKKTIVDSTLQEATKAGKMAGKIEDAADVTGRTALNIVKKSGKGASRDINKAVTALDAFNKWQHRAEMLSHVIRAATYGGAIGGLGGYLGSKLYKPE